MPSPVHPDPGPSSPCIQLAPSIAPADSHIPPCLDPSSEFVQVLTAPYHSLAEPPLPHRMQPRPDHAARCRATVNWTAAVPTKTRSSLSPSPSPSPSHAPASPLDQPIYQPHGRWAWMQGLSLDDPKQLLSLRKGAQCSASIDSATIASKEIKYICRKWKLGKQKEWYGFYSELALYKSERYLRPLQGDVVPHIVGVHVMPEAVSMTMEMPHSSFWMESSPSMPHALKERVIAAFEKIHAQGVLHGDPELRHMLIDADGKVMIIDFGMSRAIREHPSVGIESAEPEEFRLEMRKVRYKLDYMGARAREGDKVDDYLRRVRRNRKISELWKRRAKGERVGPIPQYEEDPEEYELDPPVNAQDFQEDWIPASDDCPMRVVVPGQTPEQVATRVRAFLVKLEEMCLTRPESAHSSAARHTHLQTPHINSQEENDPGASLRHPPPLGRGGSHTRYGTQGGLWPVHTAHRPRLHEPRQVGAVGGGSHRCDNDRRALSARHIEGASMRRDYIRHKHVKNAYISSVSSDPSILGGTFPSSIDVPENPRGLKPEECRKIQETRRQAMLQYSRAPKGILKRRREGDGDGDGDGDGNDGANREDGAVKAVHPTCKKLRFSVELAARSSRGRTAFADAAGGRQPRVVMCSQTRRRTMVARARPELVDFTLPSLRTLSTLVGSLMAWVHCQG